MLRNSVGALESVEFLYSSGEPRLNMLRPLKASMAIETLMLCTSIAQKPS